jgi:hypothetical protein
MPNKHRYPQITPRLPTELKDRAQRAVEERHTDLSALITTLLRWYVGDLNELPERPASDSPTKGERTMQVIECKLCRVELQKHPSYAQRASGPITTYAHPIEGFPRAYGRNVDSGNDVRSDNCGRYGVNTGAKLAEHHLSFGWIDEKTGERLCSNEDPERRGSCDRQRFHEGDHKDSTGHAWHQRNHFLLTRVEPDGSSTRHLDLFDTQPNAEVAAFYDIGGKALEWILQQGSRHYLGRLPDRVAYIISFIDVGNVGRWLASVPPAPSLSS